MTLEELIYSRLTGNAELQQSLAEYDGSPAVFLQRAPDDKAPGWGKKQYPRIEYLVDMTADPERHSSGVVTVHIYSGETDTPPENIAPDVRASLHDIIMQAERPYCTRWDRTELFELSNAQSPDTLVNGCTLTFLLIAFPAQDTKTPDPALAVQQFLKGWEPDAFVLGKDYLADIYEPSDSRPAFYVRIASYKTNRSTYALRWIDCTVAVHIIAPTPEGRNRWTRYLADTLDMIGEVTMLDDSPMLVREVAVDNAADYLTRGQLTAAAQYSIPNFGEYAHPLKEKYFNQ